MRIASGLLGLLTAGSVAAVGCRIDYDEISLALRATGGVGAQGGDSSSGGSGDAGSLGGEAGVPASSGGTGGSAGGSAGGKGSGGSSVGGSSVGGSSSSGSGGSSAAGGAGGSAGGSAGSGGSTGASGGSGATAGSGGAGGSAASGSAGDGGTGGSSTPGGASGAGGASAGSSGQGSAGSAGGPSLPDCMTSGYNGKTYLMCAPELTWDAASAQCASVGMELARVDDAAENQWLFDNAYDLDVPSDGLWIGGSDAAVDGEWRWSDGTLFWLGASGGTAQGGLYENWYSNHPGGNSLNDCLVIDLGIDTLPGWYSDRCSGGTNVFACESL